MIFLAMSSDYQRGIRRLLQGLLHEPPSSVDDNPSAGVNLSFFPNRISILISTGKTIGHSLYIPWWAEYKFL